MATCLEMKKLRPKEWSGSVRTHKQLFRPQLLSLCRARVASFSSCFSKSSIIR